MRFDIEEELYVVPLNYQKYGYHLQGVTDRTLYVIFCKDNFEVTITNLHTGKRIEMTHEHLFERFTPFWLQGDDWLEIWGNKDEYGQILEFKYQDKYQHGELWITIETYKDTDRRQVYSEPYSKFLEKWRHGKYKFEENR